MTNSRLLVIVLSGLLVATWVVLAQLRRELDALRAAPRVSVEAPVAGGGAWASGATASSWYGSGQHFGHDTTFDWGWRLDSFGGFVPHDG